MQKQKAPKKILLDKDGILDSHLNQPKQQPFNLQDFHKNLKINIKTNSNESIQFDINGIDASIANALRRIMIAEIPTMALHKVLLYQNTSVIPDEVLVHRLGLMPLKVDAKLFNYKKQEENFDGTNSLKFELRVKCEKKEEYSKLTDQQLQAKGIKPEQYLQNAEVYAKQFKWIPQGSQSQHYPQGIKFVYPDILVTKLRQNQEIYLQIFAEKGIGRTHAKWSPVSTAFYRLLPLINIKNNFNQGKSAKALVNSCPTKVFDIQDEKAYVKESRNCTTCRECIKFEGVELGKVKNHFIFTIESTGIYKASEIFLLSLQIFEQKVKSYAL